MAEPVIDLNEYRATRDQFDKMLRDFSRIAHITARDDNRYMESPSREELNAKLEALEARMDGRVARIEDAVRSVAESVKEIRAENRESTGRISSLKGTIITTAIGAVLAIVLGIAAFNATLTANMLTAFQAGLQATTTRGPAEAPPKQ